MHWLFSALLVLLATCGLAQEARDTDPAINVALGKPVSYCPAPNYRLTARGDTDGADLTDGLLTQREDQNMWFETTCVGWSYGGRVNLAVDLGEIQAIDEVAIRLLGGSAQAQICMPGWVEVMVSEGPDQPYYRVAEFSKWTPGDRDRYGIPRYEGKSWVHRLRFADLNTRGRMVGVRMYTSGLSCTDEMYVFKGHHVPEAVEFSEDDLTDFTVTGAAAHFHKPMVHVCEDIATPLPIGCVSAVVDEELPLTFSLTVPAGVQVLSGSVGGISVADAQVAEHEDGARQYSWTTASKDANTKTFGRLFVKGAPEDGQEPVVRYQTSFGDYVSPVGTSPIEVVEIPEQLVIPSRLMTSLSWGGLGFITVWPDWQAAFERIGFNTITPAGTWFKPDDQETIDFVAAARDKGYKVQMIDSTWHRMLSLNRGKSEMFDQFEDGTTGTRVCPSYRGQYYQAELERVATAAKLLKPNYIDCDIELWSWQGPLDAKKCTRCIADKEASGIETWEDWQLAKGEEMWTDLHREVQAALEEIGAPPCEMAVYDFRPGHAYQYFWPFDRLYPDTMQSSQVSVYTPLEPYHIELIGDEVREDRAKLPKSDQIPWTTPGDAGTFTGEAFYHSLLECFCNGSRGLNFWSGRVWDAELLAGYARTVRAVAPVEDIIIDGQPFLPEVDGPGRASGMRKDDEIVLLVADYHSEAGGTVRLKWTGGAPASVEDLDAAGRPLTCALAEGILTVPVPPGEARILRVKM